MRVAFGLGFLLGMAACGDSGATTLGGGGAGGDTTGGGASGAGVPTEAPACFDGSDPTGLTPLEPVAGQGLCTEMQIADFLAACLRDTSTEAGCADFLAANATCSACLGVPPSGAPTPTIHPVLLPAGTYVFVNTLACEALVQQKVDCAQPAADLLFCVFDACGTCEEELELPTCLGYAESELCSEIFPLEEDCLTLFPAEGMANPACDGADFEALFTSVAKFLCGG
jgi:hypothetical protein